MNYTRLSERLETLLLGADAVESIPFSSAGKENITANTLASNDSSLFSFLKPDIDVNLRSVNEYVQVICVYIF